MLLDLSLAEDFEDLLKQFDYVAQKFTMAKRNIRYASLFISSFFPLSYFTYLNTVNSYEKTNQL